MRSLIPTTLFFASLAFAADKPNILFIAIDDLRPELGCYGNGEVKTPHLDQLATTGLRFDRAYTQYAICGPSRACIMTGLRPVTLKIQEIDTYFRDTVPDVVTLPQHFKANGYESVYVGKVFHGKQTDDALSWSRAVKVPGGKGSEYKLPESIATVKRRQEEALAKYGADAQLQGMSSGPAWEGADAPDNEYPDGRTADAAIATLRELKGKPFFFGVGFIKPHLPFVAPKKYFDLYDAAKITLTARVGGASAFARDARNLLWPGHCGGRSEAQGGTWRSLPCGALRQRGHGLQHSHRSLPIHRLAGSPCTKRGTSRRGTLRSRDRPARDDECCGREFRAGAGSPEAVECGSDELIALLSPLPQLKSKEFDAEGNEVNVDYRRMLKIVKESGFRGYIGIEFEGHGLDPVEGINATAALIRKVMGELE